MKNLITYLKTLWGVWGNLQSKDVRHDCRLTVGSPSGLDAKWKQNPFMRFAVVLTLIFTIGSGNVWGADVTFTANVEKGSTSIEKDGITISVSGGDLSRTDNYRCYASQTMTISSSNTITKVVVNCTASGTSNYGPGKFSGTGYSYNGQVGTWSGSATSVTLSASAQVRMTSIVVTYTASCTKIGAPTVTATLGDGRIDLSWSNQTGASSYTVTKTPSGGSVGTPSKSGSTWSCAITGLTNGTTYTWSVEAVGSGDYCASGNTAASASATPNVFRTITYYDKDGQHTTSLADGTNIATALTALYGGDDPVSCDATNYEYFVGWKVGEISGTASSVTLLDDEVVNASSPSNNYYAVWSDTDPSAGGWTKVTSISVGDVVVFAYDDDYNEMTSVTTTGTTYGSATTVDPYPDDLSGVYALTVEAGNGGTGYSFKHGSVYLSWSSGNSLTTSGTKDNASSWTISESSSGNFKFANVGTTSRILQYNSGSPRWACYTSSQKAFQIYKQSAGGAPEYITTCCTDPGLAYGTGSVTKTYGEDAFTNALTNSHSVAVTYSSSDETVATVDSEGEVTILKAGSTTITASSAAQTVAAVSYCADEASYTLTVNKANISPTLSYTPNSVAVGESTSAPTVGGNPGSGGVTYAITSASPLGCATINTSTGVVTGAAVGSVTVTATVAATANYNGGSATANVTITAASYFPNGKTIFIQAESSSAWSDANYDCVKAWFHTAGGSETAQTTYWLFDATGGDSGKKLFAAIVPATGDLPYLDIQRFTHECSDWRNKNGGCSYSDANGSNTIRSTGNTDTYDAQDDYIRWNATGVTMNLMSSDAWLTPVASMTDQGSGIWSGTYEYTPSNTSTEYVIATNYNGNIGNTGSNSNATLSGMVVGSTYDVTATLDIKDHSLEMSKTFVKGTVHFDMQGHGSAISDLTNVTAGSKISAPSPAPSATGYDFGGWYKEPACTNAWNFGSDVVNETMTLYAKWTAHEYTITKTLTNVTSSPVIPSTYTYTGSAAGLNYTISPSDGYRLPTEITVSGMTYTWNPATGALALTGTISSNVTITIVAVQTHTVDWYVGGSAVGNKIGDDGQTTVVDHGGKISDFPATTPDGSACDKTFVGWTNTSSYVHGTSPLFNDVASSPQINADASFYAVFATGGSGEIFSEDFASFTSGSISSPNSSAESSLDGFDNITYVYQAGGVAKLGTGSYPGSLTTDELTIAAGSSVTISFEVFGWTSVEGDIIVSCDNSGFSDQTITYTATRDQSMESKSVTVTCTVANPKITIATSTKRAYIDNISISASSYTGHTINCADCGSSVTPTYTASPTGGTVSVTKSASPVASGSTVKTCTDVDLTVTITPASHYTLTGFTATGLSTGTATISPAVNTVVPTTSAQTFTVTVSAGATGTLNLTPTFTEDAHVAINWNVNGVNQSIAATEGLTWVYSGGDLTALPSEPSVPAGCSGTKVFAGWSEKHSDATEEDASYYDDLFTAVGDAPTGIDAAKTFYAVFATSSANPLAGEVMWDEPWTGTSDKTTPSSPSSGATVYNSTSLTYAYTNGNTTTQVYADGTMYSGGAAAPELLISKTSPSGVWTVANIPTGGSAQTELTLSYKTNKTTIAVTSGTSGITIGDATVDGNTYTHTITINHSPSTINNFSLIFTNTGSANARLDDIHLVVPGSGTMTDYVTLCAPSYTITYNKNTSDPVTNLPSPTSVLQSTGSGTLSSTVPERATYTFSGWAETTSGAVAYAAGGSISGVTGDKTLYAVWTKTPVEELFLNYSELNKYVGDPAVTLEVTGVTPEGADPSVTWSSSNSSVASVVAATGVVTFGTVGTATITATSTVTGTTTAYCYVTVRNKPTASFTDLIHDGNGTDLSTYHMQNVAGTPIVFPTLDDYATPGDDCDSKHYVFVGWTTSDNNDDPQDHLVASGELEDDQDKVFYAVWADGVEGVSYTKLTTNSFKASPTKYVIGAEYNGDTYYFYSCAATDQNNGNGGCTTSPATNAPIQFTLSGTADALVATSTEATARYLTPLTGNNFQMSATTKTIALSEDGDILNASATSWALRFNTSNKYLRWYNTAPGSAAYFYEVTSGAAVSYRTSCCTNNVPAPTVIATNTAYTVTLTWAAVDGATGYEVSWNGGAYEAATSPCVKSGLTASTDYIYKVRATYDPLVKCGALVASGSVTTDDVYSVTYSGGTGTGSCSSSGSVAPASYEAGATVTLAPTNSFSLTSNTFAAWVVKDADDNDVPVSNNQFTMPAKNVTVTATWTPVQDKYYDRMHDGTDASHGGIADGEGKYYLVLEGCNYTVPTLTDDNEGDTECHTTHFKLLGWIAQSHLKTDGSGEIKPGEESYIFQGGGAKSATGATYYAIWAIMTE